MSDVSTGFGYVYAKINCSALDKMRRIIELEGENPDIFPKWCPERVEKHSHCTIFYGINNYEKFEKDNYYDRLKMFFGEHPRTYFIPALAHVFSTAWWDCIVIRASAGLYRQSLEILHTAFQERFYGVDEISELPYEPHITLGFVKKGTGSQFLDRFNSIYDGRIPMMIDTVTVELADGESRVFDLGRM